MTKNTFLSEWFQIIRKENYFHKEINIAPIFFRNHKQSGRKAQVRISVDNIINTIQE